MSKSWCLWEGCASVEIHEDHSDDNVVNDSLHFTIFLDVNISAERAL
jgi:hypothetical protein